MKGDLLFPLVGGALMVLCCLLPLLVVGGGAMGLLAWIGGLDPALILGAVGVGGVLVYLVVRRKKTVAGRCGTGPRAAP